MPTIIRSAPSGQFVEVAIPSDIPGGGGDPVEVRSLADLPAPVASQITLAANTRYEFVGAVDIGPNVLALSNGTHVTGRAGVIQKTAGVNGVFKSVGVAALVENVTIDCRTGTSGVLIDGAASDLTLRNVAIVQTLAAGGNAINMGGASPLVGGRLRCDGCTFGPSWQRHINVFIGALDDLEVVGCVFDSSGGSALRMVQLVSTASIARVFLTGNVANVAAGCIFCEMQAGSSVGLAFATGNNCTGAGDTWGTLAAQTFSPIEVTSPTDLPGGPTVYNLAAGVTYVVCGLVDIGGGAINGAAGVRIEGRAGELRANVTIGMLATGANDVTIERLKLYNQDTGIGAYVLTGSATRLVVRDCELITDGAAGGINTNNAARVEVYDSTIETAAGYAVRSLGASQSLVVSNVLCLGGDGIRVVGTLDDLQAIGAWFDGGNGIDLSGVVQRALIAECLFDTPGGSFGIRDTAPAVAGQIVGCTFTGAGTALSGPNPSSGIWDLRGCVGRRDFQTNGYLRRIYSATFEEEHDNGTGASVAFLFAGYQFHRFTSNAVGTLTLNDPIGSRPGHFQIKLTSTSNHVISWTAATGTITWANLTGAAPTFPPAGGRRLVNLYFDGANWFGQYTPTF